MTIDPKVVDPDDIETLQDLIVGAMRDASQQVRRDGAGTAGCTWPARCAHGTTGCAAGSARYAGYAGYAGCTGAPPGQGSRLPALFEDPSRT